jgi:hypothetical protein
MTRLSMSHTADIPKGEKFKEKLSISPDKIQSGIGQPRPSFMRPHSREIAVSESRALVPAT